MNSSFAKSNLLTLLALIPVICGIFSACGPSVEQARKMFPPISKQRPLGTKSSTTDSASIKRASEHPLGPTGGWYESNNNLVDYSRTVKRDANHLEMSNGCISGYVRFGKPGYLIARSYDDYFGDVYCGWSPNKLQIKPTEQFVFVSLGTCSVGDGGLDQVHEVAWFPKDSSEGTLIFSTAHQSPGQQLTAADVYRPSLLGNVYQFNETLANKAAEDNLRKGDLAVARKVIADGLKVLSSMRDSVDGQTGKNIPALESHRNEWASMLSYKLGMSLGEPDFDATLLEFQKVIDSPGRGNSLTCDTVRKMLPLYVWLNDEVHGKQSKVPAPSKLEQSVVGHEPIYIANYLQSKTPEEEFVRRQGDTGVFWSGVKRFVSGDTKGSATRFDQFLMKKLYSSNYGFEVAAAAKMKQRF